MLLLLPLLPWLLPQCSGMFVCPQDGHYGDDDDCTKYYHCANGRPMEGQCPPGLFWSKVEHQCDWPANVDCQMTVEKARRIQQRNPTVVYLTFDDGPNEGTEHVLDALKAHGVRATFFINSQQFEPDPKKPGQELSNMRALKRIVDEGHVLADHSYDHMFHNSKGPTDAYQDVDNDIRYFGRSNSDPALTVLSGEGAGDAAMAYSGWTMDTLVRMPYSNNWRVYLLGGGGGRGRGPRELRHDCGECTVPAQSGRRAIAIANKLYERGAQVVGWDMEWNMNWNSNRIKYGGRQMFQRLGTGRHSKMPGTVVLLSHDIAFRPHEINGALNDKAELDEFLSLAVDAGYKFDTLDSTLLLQEDATEPPVQQQQQGQPQQQQQQGQHQQQEHQGQQQQQQQQERHQLQQQQLDDDYYYS